MNGYILVKKKAGMTSHDVVNIARKKLNIRKIGHTGTLDPFAEGLLILLIGNATKLAYLFDGLDKTYQGEISFGKLFDTLDLTGEVLQEKEPNLSAKSIDETLRFFTKKYAQFPPIYSAIKVDGKKLYEYAREKKDVIITPREVEVYSFERLSEITNNSFTFEASVSSGTYIRSLAFDLGKHMNELAYLSKLNRTSICVYSVADAVEVDDIAIGNIIPDIEIFKAVETKLVLDDYLIKLVRNGVALDERQIVTDKPFLVYDRNDNLVAYYEVSGKQYKVGYLF